MLISVDCRYCIMLSDRLGIRYATLHNTHSEHDKTARVPSRYCITTGVPTSSLTLPGTFW